MGSSSKKKNDKKKDFQKAKLRVGKTKAKADNHTDTSFRAKSIVVTQQSLTIDAPSQQVQFAHYLSLASSSKSDTQRRDALSYLTTTMASQPVNDVMPVSAAMMLPKLFPLILDGSSSVRMQLLKLLHILPESDVSDRVESALLYVRAGMTHLATEIRDDAVSMLDWLLQTAKEAVVSCPGGWVKTLKAFMSMMGWATSSGSTKWSSATKTSVGKRGKSYPRQLLVLARFLSIGIGEAATNIRCTRANMFPLWDIDLHMIPPRSAPYAHLNLFGSGRDEEGEMYAERESRQRIFRLMFRETVQKGMESAKREGGEAGRASAILSKTLAESMKDYSHAEQEYDDN